MTDTMIRTGNAVPSAAPEDRHDNSIALDLAANSELDTYKDRENTTRRTLKWMERAATGIPAVAAAVQAESARDAILLSNGSIYTSVAEGLPATLVGKYFNVLDADPAGYLVLYQNVAGAAVEKKRWPSSQMVKEIFDVIQAFVGEGETAFDFQDQSGFTLIKMLTSGALDMTKGRFENIDFDGVEFSGDNGFLYAYLGAQNSMINGLPLAFDSQFNGIEFQDENRFIVGKATDSGAYFGRQPTALSQAISEVAQLGQQKRTDIMGVINYGQSLSRGALAVPPISVTQLYSNIMLKSGVLPRSFDSAYDASEFVPLIAQVNGNEGESPVNGLCDGVVRRLVSEDGEVASDWVFAGMSPGRGGRTVAQLSPAPTGTEGLFEGIIEQVTDSVKLAKALNKTYSVWAYHWAQGESDYSANTTRYTYGERLAALFDQLSVDIMRTTGQKFRPYLFSYQMNANRRHGRDHMKIAQSQWALSRIRDDVVITSPNYIFATVEDNLHLTNEGSWLLGEYGSRAMKQTMISKNGKWRPLEPISVDWTPTHIDVKYRVPQGQIVIDNALAATALNSGFDLWVTRSTPLNLITSVTATGPDTVRIALSAPAPADAFLTYAMGRAGDVCGPVLGARGNVRDTHGDFDKATSPGGVQYSLHNASVAFEYNRKSGF